jgi:hypothetical protein
MAEKPKIFELPSPQALTDLAAALHLTAGQKHELDLALRHAQADLQGLSRTRVDRSRNAQLTDRLKALRTGLAKLITAMGRDPEVLTAAMPFDVREVVGWTLSAAHIAKVTGREVVASAEALERDGRSAGLLHAGPLLLAQVQLILDSIDGALKGAPTDPGGPEPNFVRHHLIVSLAEAAPAIIGRRATATANGPFLNLVTHVFNACGVSSAGLEKAVGVALASSRKAKAASGPTRR